MDGRWSPEHGQPGRCVFLEVSTNGLRPAEAYDYWRETVYYHFDADRRSGDGPNRFAAHARALIAPRGAFYAYRSEAVSGRRTADQIRADEGDDLDLGLVLGGSRRHELNGDATAMAGPGDFYVYDFTRPSRVAWKAHRGVHLTLRRQAAEAALGGTVPSAGEVARALSISGLAPFLRSQFALLARHMHTLPGSERSVVLDNTIDLALAALRGSAVGATPDREPHRHTLFVAARRYIEDNLAHPDLDAQRIAHALGCSRSTLYRAFADHGMTVASHIRDTRLARFRHLLETAPPHIAIAEIAARVGLYDTPNLSRAFRGEFGVAPSEVKGARRG